MKRLLAVSLALGCLSLGSAGATTIVETADPAVTTETLNTSIPTYDSSVTVNYTIPSEVDLGGPVAAFILEVPFAAPVTLPTTNVTNQSYFYYAGLGQRSQLDEELAVSFTPHNPPGESPYVVITGFQIYYFVSDFDTANIYPFVEAGAQSVTISGVPEPTTWATMLLGVGLLGATLRRRVIRRSFIPNIR